ncbi:MAG: diguanylate cyclase [Rubrivivax sp.]|nr:diguanylate cyclase [Rubrivivax sp.]
MNNESDRAEPAAPRPELELSLLLGGVAGAAPRRVRLLVVDDQPVNVQALYQVFAADYQVLMATSGRQALDLCRSKPPDLVLLDVVMPDMDGHALCRELKADPQTRDIPVIFVTSHSDSASEEQGLAAGAVDFIAKPINPAIVRARVKTHVTLKLQSDFLRQLAFIDGLTGVANRRHFDARLRDEARRAARNGSALSLVLLDVDHFKHFNDRYGHQAGDDCLRRLALTLRQGLQRPGDVLARYGGEEFVVLLPETELDGALQLCEILRQRVAGLAIEHSASRLKEKVVTLSMGVACASGGGPRDGQELLALADRQLYAAKGAGRAQALGARLVPQ